jgi:hypothetical protein
VCPSGELGDRDETRREPPGVCHLEFAFAGCTNNGT